MSEGISNIQDCLAAVNVLSIDLIKIFKKHAGVADAAALLLADEDLKNAVLKAFAEVSKVPAEAADLDLGEILTLAIDEAKSVPALVAALKA